MTIFLFVCYKPLQGNIRSRNLLSYQLTRKRLEGVWNHWQYVKYTCSMYMKTATQYYFDFHFPIMYNSWYKDLSTTLKCSFEWGYQIFLAWNRLSVCFGTKNTQRGCHRQDISASYCLMDRLSNSKCFCLFLMLSK